MFVCNFKLNRKFVFKLIFIFLFIIVIFIAGLAYYKIFEINKVNDEIPIPNVSNITSDNYTNILKTVHDNLDEYIGQKINFTGYIYRTFDFSDAQFVLARNMIIDANKQTLVVGFLCNCKNAKDFNDGTWVNITGKIEKGDYHGEIPVIEITEIKAVDKPVDEYVYPPDDTFIPTSALF